MNAAFLDFFFNFNFFCRGFVYLFFVIFCHNLMAERQSTRFGDSRGRFAVSLKRYGSLVGPISDEDGCVLTS